MQTTIFLSYHYQLFISLSIILLSSIPQIWPPRPIRLQKHIFRFFWNSIFQDPINIWSAKMRFLNVCNKSVLFINNWCTIDNSSVVPAGGVCSRHCCHHSLSRRIYSVSQTFSFGLHVWWSTSSKTKLNAFSSEYPTYWTN